MCLLCVVIVCIALDAGRHMLAVSAAWTACQAFEPGVGCVSTCHTTSRTARSSPCTAVSGGFEPYMYMHGTAPAFLIPGWVPPISFDESSLHGTVVHYRATSSTEPEQQQQHKTTRARPLPTLLDPISAAGSGRPGPTVGLQQPASSPPTRPRSLAHRRSCPAARPQRATHKRHAVSPTSPHVLDPSQRRR